MKNTVKLIPFFILVSAVGCGVVNREDNSSKNKNAMLALAGIAAGSKTAAVSTLSLSESGQSNAKLILNQPEDLTVMDGIIYIADSKNNRIIKIESEKTVTAIATSAGNGSDVTVINNPEGITAGDNGLLYVPNTGASTATNGAFDGHNIFTINTKSSNQIKLLSGKDRPTLRETIDGAQGTNRFYKPEGIAYSASFKKLIAAEAGGNSIREVNITDGSVTTVTGEKASGGSAPTGGTPIATDGPASTARFSSPTGAAIDSKGNIFVADEGNNCIRKIDTSKIVSTFAGSNAGGDSAKGYADGTGTAARFSGPYKIVIDSDDNLYVSDTGNYAIRKITPAGLVTTVAGGKGSGRDDGTASSAKFYKPTGLCIYGNTMYVTDKALARTSTTADLNTDYSAVRKIVNF